MAGIVVSPTQEMPNMEPEYEVRLQLNPTAVLGPDHELTGTVLATFDMPPTVTKLNVQFLDNSCKEIYTAGWSPRIRKTEHEDKFELTYKKRYAIMDGDIDAALAVASHHGFDTGDAKYEAQVEWGYQKQTLSISRKKTVADSGNSGTELPGTSKSRKMLIDEAPDKFDNWKHNQWGTGALAMSRIFGPVLASRSIGTWNGMRLYLEVWPLSNLAGTGIEYLIEASFKTKSRTTASVEQSDLAAYLQSKGWFLAQDSLKTQLIMERY
ncbi:hypothetical protein BDW59DRAFT_178111 [Aspergillus cavernicola]|uniref:Uncharacterized protein n=1 Tax=Aspergillus cavernicola TaxID=176166 RepID=A0ABR4HEN4_9EURO